MITTFVASKIKKKENQYFVSFASQFTKDSKARDYSRGFNTYDEAILFRKQLINDMLTMYTFST